MAGQAAVRLLAQVVEVQLVDQAACDAHHLAATRQRVVAVGGADDPKAAMLEALHDALGLADLATQPIEALQHQHVKALRERIGEQRLAAWSQRDGRAAADAFVRVDRGDRPSFARDTLTRRAQLVVDAVLGLLVRAVPRVQACLQSHR
ncbi:hypothetical protein ASC98_14500 [Rhizobacter sp. Root1238]|nr:hypothetical protein ASC88_07415 [Rhizobacter sp. Root29]KQW15327.1 hypothetical protein ASC98_14500 [Rhizobacter sp. Root1238]